MADLTHILGLLGLGKFMLTLDKPDKLHAALVRHEGVRLKPYVDTTGHLTIGVGHDLTDDGVSLAVAEHLLSEDITKAMQETADMLPWVATLDDVRKRAFVEMTFNLGERLQAFHVALSAAQKGDWAGCVAGLKNSLWHIQVGHRAVDLEAMLLSGTDPA